MTIAAEGATTPDSVVVIGGGIGGLAAARRLAKSGAQVTVFEAAPQLGGLVRDFEIAGTPLERFYHYLLPGEPEILELLDELGLSHRVEWFDSSIGILTDGRIWPFTTPADLLRFTPLAPVDRMRTGVAALRLGRIRDWRALDRLSAIDWLTQLTSPEVTRVVWGPLLKAKFGPAAPRVPAGWMWGRLQQRRGARKGTGEQLGYLRGGFHLLFDALERDLMEAGVSIRTNARAHEIILDSGKVTGVQLADSSERIDAGTVLFCGVLPGLPALLPEAAHDTRWTQTAGLGCICLIFDLPYPLTEVLWTNVCDENVPFGGIIEHTNLLPTSWYRARHVVYLSRYFTQDEDVARASLTDLKESWIVACERLFPRFSRGDIGEQHIFRTPYAAPLVSTPYLPQIAPVHSHIPGLYLSTTAQIYPQDRGMSEGIKRGIHAADAMLRSGWRCPVCRSLESTPAFGVSSEIGENGVDPDNFRPSSSIYGQVVAEVRRCDQCGHGSLAEMPASASVQEAYQLAVDELTLQEERGQVETASRGLKLVERFVAPGRLLDVGCWTGSLLEAARRRGWDAAGIEPSLWAASRAGERSLTVHNCELNEAPLEPGSFQTVVMCDVLEHLADPGVALDQVSELLETGGVLYLTVPDAGSRLARAMGRHWWSVMPMHLQYFTRQSMARLLDAHRFEISHVGTHAKVFTLRYYGGRAANFLPGGSVIDRLAKHLPGSDKLIAPDFGDRMAVIATRR